MSLNNTDFEAKQASFMTADWLSEAVKVIDTTFCNGYAEKNPILLSSFIQAASRKYHASVLGGDSVLEQIVFSIDRIAESIDCAGINPVEFWMQSDIAAIDKANELGINILPEYSMADLRYKIYSAIHEVV